MEGMTGGVLKNADSKLDPSETDHKMDSCDRLLKNTLSFGLH